MKARKILQKAVAGIKSFKNLRFKVTHEQLLLTTMVSIILLIAFSIRLLPMRWGWHLSEFDPYVHYRSAEYAVNNGLSAWLTWHDTQRWYPYGISPSKTLFPGVGLTAAFFYKIMQMLALPISLYDFVVVFPPIMAVLACLVIYFLGKDIGGKTVGLLSALFLALNGSYIGRTSLGFFDDETIGILSILFIAYSFSRSLDAERTWSSTIKYSVASGLALGYIFASWGAALYPFSLLTLFVFALIMVKHYSRRLLLSYTITLGLGLFIAVIIPKLSISFLFTLPVLAALAVLSLLCLCEILQNTKTSKWKLVYLAGYVAIIGIAVALLFGKATLPATKFMIVLNPFQRLLIPIAESVQEHRPSAWGSFYYDYGIGILFIVIGLYFAVRNPTNRNIFLTLYALTSLYFASSMVRLTIVLAPAFCILWAIGLVGILKPFITVMKEVPKMPFKKKYVFGHVGKEFSGTAIILIMVLLLFTFVLPSRESQLRGESHPRVIDQAYNPVTIMASGAPLKADEPILEWYKTLMWMKTDLPADAIVVSWWDYGYWITIIANKTTLADNATINMTQIVDIGTMFLSNETEAIKILKSERYERGQRRPEYVAVFTTFDGQGNDRGYGDEGKWRWMARIAGLNESDYGSTDQQGRWTWNTKGQETLIYKLMTYAKDQKLGRTPTVELQHFEPAYISEGKNYGGTIILVAVYKVLY